MRSFVSFPHRSATLVVALLLVSATDAQQITQQGRIRFNGCGPQLDIEFLAPMPTEECPVLPPAVFPPDAMHVVLELSSDPTSPVGPGIFEGTYLPAPGFIAVPATDVNTDGVIGDPHPAFPSLLLTMDDDILVAGTLLPAGTNLASLVEIIGSEIEHGGDQSTILSWILDPIAYVVIDINGDLGTTLKASVGPASDTVFFRHGFGPISGGVSSAQTPTISIFSPDWISTVDDAVMADLETPFVVGVEVRIPCWFNNATIPPTPVPLDPIFGPCQGGTMACTGNFPALPGPGFNPAFPSLDVRFSDDYTDPLGTFVPGGVITGGQCGVIWGSTGASLAYAFRQASVHAWYGVNGFPDTTPLGGGDDQLIYRFIMNVDGDIFDTDVLPREMMITAAIESTTNCFSITNVRVKHRPDVTTRNP